jgi:hypothetical protein
VLHSSIEIHTAHIVVAAAKEMLVIVWHMLIKNEPYRTMNREMVERKYKKMERESNMS